jgi:hypothetical protein
LDKKERVLVCSFLVLLFVSNFCVFVFYEGCVEEKDVLLLRYQDENCELVAQNEELVGMYGDLSEDYGDLQSSVLALNEDQGLIQDFDVFRDKVLESVDVDCIPVALLYYTNFSKNEQLVVLSVPDCDYDLYHRRWHPRWLENLDVRGIAEYVTVDDSSLNQIVSVVRSQTQTREELANALLDLVQDKGHVLSLRCYPSAVTEYKFPVETLVEMGGDCDAHAFLYATLMKIAGFKIVLLVSDVVDMSCHVAVGVNLDGVPENSLLGVNDFYFVCDGEKYYFAETTSSGWRVGDLPEKLGNVTFTVIPL